MQRLNLKSNFSVINKFTQYGNHLSIRDVMYDTVYIIAPNRSYVSQEIWNMVSLYIPYITHLIT